MSQAVWVVRARPAAVPATVASRSSHPSFHRRSNKMCVAVSATRGPGLTDEPIVHPWKVAVALAKFPTQEGHPLDHTCIGQSTCIHKTEWHRLDDLEKVPFGSGVVSDNEDVGHGPVEGRGVEDFPPDVLEGAD